MACCTLKQTARRNQTWCCLCLSLVQNLYLGLARSLIWDQYQVSSHCDRCHYRHIKFIKSLLFYIFSPKLGYCKTVVQACSFLKRKSLPVHEHNRVVNNWHFIIKLDRVDLHLCDIFQRQLKIPMERMTIKVLSLCSPRSNEAMPRMSLCGLRPVDYR